MIIVLPSCLPWGEMNLKRKQALLLREYGIDVVLPKPNKYPLTN